MKSRVYPLIALSLLAQAAISSSGVPARAPALSPIHASELSTRSSTKLESLRAGRVPAPAVASDERAALRAASARNPELASMRAGALSDHEWTLIGIGAAVILILVLI